MVIVSIPLLGDYQYPGYHPPSIQYWHGYCVDTSIGGLLAPGGIIHPVFSTGMVIVSIPLLGDYQYPGVSFTQYSVLAWLLCRYLCWGTISTRGYHPPSIQYWHGYCVDTSARGLLVPGGIIHPVFSTGMVIVSIPLLGDYQYPWGVIHPVFSTAMVIVSIPLLGDYQYPGYHPPSIQYWHGYCVDISARGLLVPGVSSTQYSVLAWLLCRYLCWRNISTRGIIYPVFSTAMVNVSIPLLGDYQYPGYHPPSIQYWHGYCVDTSTRGLLVPGVSSTQYSVLAWLLCRFLCWGTISTLEYHPPSIQYSHGYCVDTSEGGLLVPGGISQYSVLAYLLCRYPASIQYWHIYCVDTSAGGLLVPRGILHPVFSTGMVIVSIPLLWDYQYPGVSSTQYSVLPCLLFRYLCQGAISTRGYHPPSFQYWHGYCVDTSAAGLLVPGGILHSVFSTGMVIVSIPLLGVLLVPELSSTQYSVLAWLLCRYLYWGDYQYPGVSSTQYSVLAWLLCRYLCWETFSKRGYHPPSIQYWHGYYVDTSAGGLLVPGGILHPVFFTAMVIVSIPLLGDYQNAGYHPPSIQYWHDYCVDITARGLLVSGVSSTQYSVLTRLLCRYLCWRTISTLGYHPLSIQSWHGYCVDTSAGGLLVPGGIIHSVFSPGMVIVSIHLLEDYQYPGYHPPSIQYWHGYCVDTSHGGLLVPEGIIHPVFSTGMVIVSITLLGDYQYPGVSSTQYSVLAWLLCRYLCWGTISTRGYHPPSIQYWHGYFVDTSPGGLLVPGGIIHPVFSTGMVIVSIPLLGDYQYPGVSSTQYSVLAWLLCRYLYWGTISTRGYHSPSIQYWHGYCVDTSAGGLLVPGGIIHPVFSTGMVIVSIPLLGDYQYPGVSSTQFSVLAWLLCRYLCQGTISTRGVSFTQYSVLPWLLCRYLCQGTISTRGIIHPVFSTGMVIVSISLLGDYQYPGYHPPSIQYQHGYCVDTCAGGILVPGVSFTQYSVLLWLMCRYLCWGTISTRGIIHPVFSTGMVIVSIPLLGDYKYQGYHPPSIQYWHGYCVDSSAGGLLVPWSIIHPVFSTRMVIVSIPLKGDYQYPGVSSTQYSLLPWLLCRYLCQGTIRTRGIIHPVFSIGMIIVSISLLGDYQYPGYHPPSIQY